jgi:uncharacterized integral membrane protein
MEKRPKYLAPIGKGPWVEDRAIYRAWWHIIGVGLGPMVGTGLVVQLLIWANSTPYERYWPSVLWMVPLGLGALLILAGIGVGVGALLPRMAQLCPKCLRGMTLGATRCPHCHFDPAQEPV